MPEFTGWLLDLFEDPREGLVLYFMAEDGARWRLTQPFPVTFYALGPDAQLRALWQHLSGRTDVNLSRTQRMDVFKRRQVTVMGITVQNPYEVSKVFHQIASNFPNLDYADADLQISLRFAARTGAFPLAYCRVTADEDRHLVDIEVKEEVGEIWPRQVPFRVMSLGAGCRSASRPAALSQSGSWGRRIPFRPARLASAADQPARHDPAP